MQAWIKYHGQCDARPNAESDVNQVAWVASRHRQLVLHYDALEDLAGVPDAIFRRLAVKCGLMSCNDVRAAWWAYQAIRGAVINDGADLELVEHL